MVKPDLILTWAIHMDYPLFRYNLLRFRPYFNKVLIGLTSHGKIENHTNWLVNNIDAEFKSIPMGPGDWRNNAVNTMLEKTTSEYVLFLEQDFLVRDERLFEVLLNNFEYPFIYYNEQGRIHPACALVSKAVIEQTHKEFSANPPVWDHFGQFFNEVSKVNHGADLEELGLHSGVDFYHMAGLTQNYHATPYFKPDEFLTYNDLAQKLPIPYNDFRHVMEQIEKPGQLNETIASFFPKEVVA